MKASREKAETALYAAITARAGRATSVETIEKLAASYSKVAYGPQGGHLASERKAEETVIYPDKDPRLTGFGK